MIHTKGELTLRVWFVFSILIIGLGLLAWPPTAVQADLPPRERPAAPPGDNGEDDSSPPPGAYIQLQAVSVRAGMWTAVQWQDNAGNWHDVTGWRGDIANSSRWWVDAKDFGTGPFRWVVKDRPEGDVLGVSASFHLPGRANETVQVVASVAE